MADTDVILIVEPHTLSDPRVVTDVQLPRKGNPSSGTKHDPLANLGTKHPEHLYPQPRANLPGVRYKEPLENSPEVYEHHRPIPSRLFTRRVS